MARLKAGQRVVKSVPDRGGKVYSKNASEGTKSRMQGAAKYIDKHEQSQLYTVDETGQFRETDRHEATQRIEETESKYSQHVVFTTELDPDTTIVDKEEYARMVTESVREVRPDADIYAVSVHDDTDNLHTHVTFGTDTTIRKEQLEEFRQHAYQHERKLIEHGREAERTPDEKKWIEEQQEKYQHQQGRRQEAGRDDELER